VKVLLASSEVHPYSKTGGLADMVGALAKTLARSGHQVGLVTPLYSGIRERFPGLKPSGLPLDFSLGARRVTGEVFCLESAERLTIYFIDQPSLYQRAGLYQEYGRDYPDNAERFVFFSKAVAHLALNLALEARAVAFARLAGESSRLVGSTLEKAARAGECTSNLPHYSQSRLFRVCFRRPNTRLTNLSWLFYAGRRGVLRQSELF